MEENIFNIELLNFIKKYQSSAWLGHLEFAIFLSNLVKPKLTVELGVDYAHSTYALAASGSGVVVGIDCFEGDVHAGHRNTYDLVTSTYQQLLDKKLLKIDNIRFVKGYFDDVFEGFEGSIDILHIDGLHTYEAVKNDFTKWSSKLSDGGVIIMHDITAFPHTVGRFFNEIEWPKTRVNHSAGLGIVAKKPEIIEMINEKWVSKLMNHPTNGNCLAHPDYPEISIGK